MKIHSLIIAGSLFFIAAAAVAEEKAPALQWGIYSEGYYSYDFNRPAGVTQSTTAPAAQNLYRYYDFYHDTLALGLAELSLKATKGDFSVITELDFGPFADFNANQPSGNVDGVSKNLGQFIVTYHSEGSRWTLDFGKMYTHVGLETPKAKDNWQFSRSVLMANGMPFWHTGVHAGYDILPGELTASGYVYNGWNSLYDNNAAKTLGGELKWVKGPTTVVYNYLGGPEQAHNESNWKVIHELNATTEFLPSWQVAVDGLLGHERNVVIGTATSPTPRALWEGASLAVKKQLNPKVFLSPRYEWYHDNSGLTLNGGDQIVQSGTLTCAWQAAEPLQLRAEGRGDWSNKASFKMGTNLKHSQLTGLIGLLLQI
jgi:Putative beta-barrel porin-2, OmpL-like. bbp2